MIFGIFYCLIDNGSPSLRWLKINFKFWLCMDSIFWGFGFFFTWCSYTFAVKPMNSLFELFIMNFAPDFWGEVPRSESFRTWRLKSPRWAIWAWAIMSWFCFYEPSRFFLCACFWLIWLATSKTWDTPSICCSPYFVLISMELMLALFSIDASSNTSSWFAGSTLRDLSNADCVSVSWIFQENWGSC